MARCPDSGCDKYQTNGEKVWFEVKEDGLHSTDPDCECFLDYYTWLTCDAGLKNQWAVTPLIPAPNDGVNYTIPACLKPG
jgi:hypothetical protein